jgi:hypothetical protein
MPVIAYVSAENEANNHCATRGTADCYDTDLATVSNYNALVYQFSQLLSWKRCPILLIAGISGDMGEGEPPPTHSPGNDFFRTCVPNVGCTMNPPMYQSVGALAPHNYGGGAHGIALAIRNRDAAFHTTSVILLEEYGYPTDDVVRSPKDHREGCWDPWDFTVRDLQGNLCPSNQRYPANPNNPDQNGNFSASFYTEKNARTIRGAYGDVWGGGSAFMVADIQQKNCSNKPQDFFTGLFSIDSSYCGGTYHFATDVAHPQPKATGNRVRVHNCWWPQYDPLCNN